GEENQLTGAESRRAGDRHLIGVDVVDVSLAIARHTGHHRQIVVLSEQMQQCGIGPGDPTYRAESRIELLGLGEKRINAGEPDGWSPSLVEARDQLVIHAACEN